MPGSTRAAERSAELFGVIETALGVGPSRGRIGLHEPELGAPERDAILDCLDSGFVSSVGQYVTRFERMLAEVTGAPHVVATTSGTAGLHVALVGAGVGPGDEVLIPGISFAATANAVRHAGAVPHFVDVSLPVLGMCPEALEERIEDVAERSVDGSLVNRDTGRTIRALVLVHVFGHPARARAIAESCARHGIALVEDAAEGLGSLVGDRHVGRFGHAGVLSFNGNKIITTGGGGAVLFEDEESAALVRHLTTTARVPHRWVYDHDMVGFNYRMPNLNAALGVGQMSRLPSFLEEKARLAARYDAGFESLGVTTVRPEPDTTSNRWLNAIWTAGSEERQALLEHAWERGVHLRPVWRPLHRLRMYLEAPRGPMTVTEDAGARVVNLPSSPVLGREPNP